MRFNTHMNVCVVVDAREQCHCSSFQYERVYVFKNILDGKGDFLLFWKSMEGSCNQKTSYNTEALDDGSFLCFVLSSEARQGP